MVRAVVSSLPPAASSSSSRSAPPSAWESQFYQGSSYGRGPMMPPPGRFSEFVPQHSATARHPAGPAFPPAHGSGYQVHDRFTSPCCSLSAVFIELHVCSLCYSIFTHRRVPMVGRSSGGRPLFPILLGTRGRAVLPHTAATRLTILGEPPDQIFSKFEFLHVFSLLQLPRGDAALPRP